MRVERRAPGKDRQRHRHNIARLVSAVGSRIVVRNCRREYLLEGKGQDGRLRHDHRCGYGYVADGTIGDRKRGDHANRNCTGETKPVPAPNRYATGGCSVENPSNPGAVRQAVVILFSICGVFRSWPAECMTPLRMDPITAGAAGGLRARMEALDMLANNIANAATAGFKKDSEFYSMFEDAESVVWGSGTAGMPLIDKAWTDHSQGTLTTTGAKTDLALSGPGLFAVNGPSGPLYTRSGNFRIDGNGMLTTQEGYALRLAGGLPLQVGAGPFDITHDGTVRQGDTVLGRLDVVEFAPEELVKQGASLFRAADAATTGKPARTTEIHQGKLESSNVSTAESAVRMVSLMRQTEALQKAISIGAEMNRRAIEEVARVGS